MTSAGFPSPAWRAGLAERLAACSPVGGRRLALGEVVTGTSGDETASWTIFLGGGEPARLADGVADAEVCLVGDEDSLRSLIEGTPAATLLAAGRLKVRGDANALIESQEALAGLGEALGGGAGGDAP